MPFEIRRNLFIGLAAFAGAGCAWAQGPVHTSIDAAEKIARQTGRPIFAIAGKKT